MQNNAKDNVMQVTLFRRIIRHENLKKKKKS